MKEGSHLSAPLPWPSAPTKILVALGLVRWTRPAIPYHVYHTIPYHTIPYHTIPYHTIPYHTKHNTKNKFSSIYRVWKRNFKNRPTSDSISTLSRFQVVCKKYIALHIRCIIGRHDVKSSCQSHGFSKCEKWEGRTLQWAEWSLTKLFPQYHSPNFWLGRLFLFSRYWWPLSIIR